MSSPLTPLLGFVANFLSGILIFFQPLKNFSSELIEIKHRQRTKANGSLQK
jgi:hypothetical protein